MIRQDIQKGKYNLPPAPKKPVPVCAKCGFNLAHIAYKTKDVNFCSNCGTKVNYEDRMKKWKQEKRKWRERCNAIHEHFKKDLFEYLDITNHPKREKLFELAWEYGHSNGLNSVVDYAEELVELLE